MIWPTINLLAFSKSALLKSTAAALDALFISELLLPTNTTLDVRLEPPTVLPPDAKAYAEPV